MLPTNALLTFRTLPHWSRHGRSSNSVLMKPVSSDTFASLGARSSATPPWQNPLSRYVCESRRKIERDAPLAEPAFPDTFASLGARSSATPPWQNPLSPIRLRVRSLGARSSATPPWQNPLSRYVCESRRKIERDAPLAEPAFPDTFASLGARSSATPPWQNPLSRHVRGSRRRTVRLAPWGYRVSQFGYYLQGLGTPVARSCKQRTNASVGERFGYGRQLLALFAAKALGPRHSPYSAAA